MFAAAFGIYAWLRSMWARLAPSPSLPTLRVDDLPAARGGWAHRYHDGEKFSGGFGPTDLLTMDYPTLRARSVQLFRTNLYARGLIRRLITNEINVGLHLEATPEESILGFEDDALSDWSEGVETRFELWGRSARMCDHTERRTFGALQATVRREALISGDVLVVLRQDRKTQLPRIQIVPGSSVVSPLGRPRLRQGHRVVHGVELDSQGRQVAYWVRQRVSGASFRWRSRRIPARGERTGRRNAWLVYGTDKLVDDVRGEPLLSLVLQSLREIDRYRDSVQRKAVVNSMLAMFVKKTSAKPGTMPITNGAIRRDVVTQQAEGGGVRRFRTAEMIPGLVIDELQEGEEPTAFTSQGTDERFGQFEEAIIQAIAWAHEVPPEILRLTFSNNYSASQAAINEYKTYLNRVRTLFGATFCEPVYQEWLLSEVLAQRVSAPGLLESWRDPERYDEVGAWMASEWAGQIKPSVDLPKLVRGYREMRDEGWITNDQAARELNGSKFTKNVRRLRIENAQLAEVRRLLPPVGVQTEDEEPLDREAA